MIDTHRQNSRYTRILGIGLGVSVAVHVAIFALARFSWDSADAGQQVLEVVALVEPEEREPLEEMGEADLAAPTEPGALELAEAQVSSGLGTSLEHMRVLALAESSPLQLPVVPQPRMDPATAESGLTPIHVLEPIALATPSTDRIASGGTRIGFFGGHGDKCVPRGGGGLLPPRRLPIARHYDSVRLPGF